MPFTGIFVIKRRPDNTTTLEKITFLLKKYISNKLRNTYDRIARFYDQTAILNSKSARKFPLFFYTEVF